MPLTNLSEQDHHAVTRTRLAALVRSSADAIIGETLEGIVTDWNPAAERLYGYMAEEVIGQHFSMLAPPHECAVLAEWTARVHAGESIEGLEAVRWTKDGRRLEVSLTVSPVYDDAGEIVATSAIVRDISAQKQLERELLASEARFRTLVEQLPGAVYLLADDEMQTPLYFSPSIEQVTGETPEEAMAIHDLWLELVHPEDRERVAAEDARHGVDTDLFRMEYRHRHKNGSYVWVHDECVPVHDDAGRVVAWQGVMFDITARVEAEIALQREQDLLRALMDHLPDAIYIKDTASRFLRLNLTTAHTLGITDPTEAIGKTDFDFYPEDLAREYFADEQHVVTIGTPLLNQLEARSEEIAAPGWWLTSTVPVRDATGAVVGLVGSGRDITERLRTEEALRESEVRHRALLAAMPDMVFRLDRAGTILDYKADRLDDLVAPPETFLGRTVGETLPPDVARAIEAAIGRVLGSGGTETVEYTLELSGDRRDFEARLVTADVDEIVAVVRNISAVKAHERALAASEALLRVAFENAPIGMILVRPDIQMLRVNRALCEMLGYTAEELLTTNFWAFTHADDIALNQDLMERALYGEIDSYEMDKRYLHRGGHIVWGHLSGSLVRDEDGTPRYFVSQIENITARKAADDALAASEERFRIAFADAPIGMALVAADERILQANRALCTMLGNTEEELTGTTLRSRTHPDDIAANNALVERARAGELHSYALEKRYLRQDGQTVWASLTVSSVRDATGAIRYFISQIQDISERKAAEHALAASEIRFRTAFENAPIGIALVALDGRHLQVNAALCALTGYSEPELLATTFQAITHPDDLAADQGQVDEVLAGARRSFQMEKRYLRKDGQVVWVRLSTALIRDEQGTPRYFIGQVEDITARKAAEVEVAATHQQTREVLDRITDNFYALDEQGRFTYINDAMERNFGYPRDELLGQSMWERFPQNLDTPFYAAFQQARTDGRARTVEAFYPQTDRWYESRIYPSPNGLSVFFRDVTDLKQHQQELQDALEAAQAGVRAKTRFLAMMSHELRTPLQAILGNAELLLAGSDGRLTPMQAEDVGAIHGGAKRMTTLIEQLLALSRAEADSPDRTVGSVDLLGVVDQVREDLAPHATAKQLALRVDLPTRLPSVQGDPVRLRQTLLNLVGNAIKFTEVGEVRISAEVAEGDVAITVRDTGIGIAAEALPLIFEEFYQVDSAMNRRYEGAGLGLAIATRLVEHMGGRLSVESKPGVGSTFTLHLSTTVASADATKSR